MNQNISHELEQMKYLFGYQKGKVISEQQTAPAPLSPADLIGQIQTILNTKYNANLAVDKKWGPNTQKALDAAIQAKKAAAPAPAQTGTQSGSGTQALAIGGTAPSADALKKLSQQFYQQNPQLATQAPATQSPATQSPATQAPVTQGTDQQTATPLQQYNQASTDFANAQANLRNARATGDRAQIGAARGQQQAARKERRLARRAYNQPE